MISDDILEYLRRICIVLHRHKVTYLIVGGVAVNHYGLQRVSGISNYNQSLKADLDFWYQPTISNFNKLVDALTDLDVDTNDLQKLVFDPKKTFLKIPHKEFHTDFLPALDGLDSFNDCKQKAEKINLANIEIYILSLDDLILNKKFVNREIDRNDISQLRKLKKRRGKRI